MALNTPKTVAKEVVAEEVAAATVETDGVVELAKAGEAEQVVETVAEQVAVTPEKEVAVVGQSQTTEVAAKTATTAIGSPDQFSTNMAAEGMEGLELDGFSFPAISLPGEGYFQLMGDEESDLGKEFVFSIQSSRSRYVVRENNDKEADSFMSYSADGATKTDGTSSEATLAQWAADSGEDNYKPIIKKYLDVVSFLDSVDESSDDAAALEGDIVVLSVPPTSVSKFSGVIARAKMKGMKTDEIQIKASVGKKVKSDQGSFYPWVFKLA